jgi:hypothetical protein
MMTTEEIHTVLHHLIILEVQYMAFDVRQNLFDREGMPLEKKTGRYEKQLIELFRKSPEGQALHLNPGFWAHSLIDYGIQYLGIPPTRMSSDDLRELLFDIFPRKVSADADEAPQAIRECGLSGNLYNVSSNLRTQLLCSKYWMTKQLAR